MTPRDWIALVIATGLLLWGIISLVLVGWQGRPLSDVGGQALLTISGGLLVAFGNYFAKRNGE